jgi:hypothetical protein
MSLRDMIVLRVWGSGLGTKTNSNARGTRDPEEGSKDFWPPKSRAEIKAVPKHRLLKCPGAAEAPGGPGYHRVLAPDQPKSDTPQLAKAPRKPPKIFFVLA